MEPLPIFSGLWIELCRDVPYLDDVVVFSTSWEDYLIHLRQILLRIHSAGLTLNTKKCEWAKREVCYLGYHLGNGQIRPQVDKV